MKLIQRTLVILGLIVVALAASWLPLRDPAPDGSTSKSTTAPDEPALSAPVPPAPPSAAPVAVVPRTPPAGPRPSMSKADQALASEVVQLVNAERRLARCKPVRVDAKLATAALGHSDDMARRGYFNHNTAEGVDPWQRARAAGYQDPTSENIAMGYQTARAVMVGWMDSSGHRANILDCKSGAMGVGIARNSAGTPYWTQLFGAR
jgi:uncharacterized protein YkwD